MSQTVNFAIASKSFQHLIYPIALDRGYKKEGNAADRRAINQTSHPGHGAAGLSLEPRVREAR
jgi:hypothetical protein